MPTRTVFFFSFCLCDARPFVFFFLERALATPCIGIASVLVLESFVCFHAGSLVHYCGQSSMCQHIKKNSTCNTTDLCTGFIGFVSENKDFHLLWYDTYSENETDA